jgi:hypothetical protein
MSPAGGFLQQGLFFFLISFCSSFHSDSILSSFEKVSFSIESFDWGTKPIRNGGTMEPTKDEAIGAFPNRQAQGST